MAADPMKLAALLGATPEPECMREERLQREREVAARPRSKASRDVITQVELVNWRARFDSVVRVDDLDRAWAAEPGKQWEAVSLAKLWLDSGDDRGLLLRGPCGCGKTYAAAYVVRQMLRAPGSQSGVLWLDADAVVSAIMHAYDPSSPQLTPAVRLVVVDDVGMESKAEFSHAMCKLLDRPRTRVVATSNLLKPAFAERYPDERLRTRMNHRMKCFDLKSKNLRRTDGGAF